MYTKCSVLISEPGKIPSSQDRQWVDEKILSDIAMHDPLIKPHKG